jgi:hypothetical protein
MCFDDRRVTRDTSTPCPSDPASASFSPKNFILSHDFLQRSVSAGLALAVGPPLPLEPGPSEVTVEQPPIESAAVKKKS